MKNCYVYMIKNLHNGKFYIGGTKNLKARKRSHLNGHKNSGNRMMKKDIEKFGKEAFKFIILCCCKAENLSRLEAAWIERLKPKYNLTFVSDGKHKAKPEARRRMSESAPKTKSASHRRKIGEANSRRIFTDEMRRNLSRNRKDKPISKAHIEAIRQSLKNIPKTKTHRKKISEALKRFHQRKREENVCR